ncbi:MAG: zinc ABC transporter substrate-binding protein [Tannerella sp.]|nr:zinc ABC transporter substrate-binding protein [Tannerella sp.]
MVSLLLPVFISGCSHRQIHEQRISVTIEPQRYFATKLAGGLFEIHTVVPVGQSPETYDPAPHEMINIAQSRAYFQIGRIGFEQAWMKTIKNNNPDVLFFDLSEGIHWLGAETDCGHDCSHRHSGSSVDPHIWNSTKSARLIAQNTLNAFVQLDPEHTAVYRENYRQLMDEIEETEQLLHEKLDTLTRRTFIIYHPALTYFADEFNLHQFAIEEEGKEPSAASMKKLVDTARAANVRVVFVQQEFDRKHAELLAEETGARIVSINPLDGRWKEQMLYIADELIK